MFLTTRCSGRESISIGYGTTEKGAFKLISFFQALDNEEVNSWGLLQLKLNQSYKARTGRFLAIDEGKRE